MSELNKALRIYKKESKVKNNNVYTNNLNLLLEAKSEDDFLYRYNLIQESGLDTIDMPFVIFNSRLRGSHNLQTLQLKAVEAVLELI